MTTSFLSWDIQEPYGQKIGNTLQCVILMASIQKLTNGETFNGINGTQVPLPYYIPNVSLGGLAAAQYPLYNIKDQLFDLKNDPYETTNLFNTQPQKSTELRNILRTELLSFPNRPYQEFTDTNVDLSVSYRKYFNFRKGFSGLSRLVQYTNRWLKSWLAAL